MTPTLIASLAVGLLPLWVPGRSVLLAQTAAVTAVHAVPPRLSDSGAEKLTLDQKEQFLRNAQILGTRPIRKGIAKTRRATLSDGHVTHDAHIQNVDIYKAEYKTDKGANGKDFKDSYKFNIAAYQLDKFLGLNMTPPCVERIVDAKRSSVCWWVDNILMDEEQRRARKEEAPDLQNWANQLNVVRVFDQLIANEDRNQGNLLITKDWKLVMIDHTRAFRPTHQLLNPKTLTRCSKKLQESMRRLDKPILERNLMPYVTPPEIDALLERRDLIVKYFESEVAQKGEDAVFTDMPRSTPNVTVP